MPPSSIASSSSVYVDQETFLIHKVEETQRFSRERIQRQREEGLAALENEPNVSALDLERAQKWSTKPVRGAFSVEATTIYVPEIEEDIDPAEFEFSVAG